MTDELSVRRYRSADRESVWEVHERAFRASPLRFVADAPADRDLRRIRDAYLESGGEFLVGEVDEEVIAVGGFQPADGDATVEIRRMRVDPDHQRSGHGATLLSSLEDAARREGYRRTVLETHERLVAAQKFYESRGYRETSRREGPDGSDRIRYERGL